MSTGELSARYKNVASVGLAYVSAIALWTLLAFLITNFSSLQNLYVYYALYAIGLIPFLALVRKRITFLYKIEDNEGLRGFFVSRIPIWLLPAVPLLLMLIPLYSHVFLTMVLINAIILALGISTFGMGVLLLIIFYHLARTRLQITLFTIAGIASAFLIAHTANLTSVAELVGTVNVGLALFLWQVDLGLDKNRKILISRTLFLATLFSVPAYVTASFMSGNSLTLSYTNPVPFTETVFLTLSCTLLLLGVATILYGMYVSKVGDEEIEPKAAPIVSEET